MRECFLLLLVLGTLQAHAKAGKDKKLILSHPTQAADTNEDPGSATQLLFKDPRTQPLAPFDGTEKTGKISLTATCTDTLGMIYKKGDSGYDGCLRSQNLSQPTDAPGARPRNSVGITIGK